MARSRNAVFRPRTRIRLAPKSRARYNRLPRNSTLDGLDERLRILFLFNYTVLVGILYYDAAPRIERKGGLMTVFRDYFSREGGRDANTAGVIWIFYGGDDRRKIEVGLLDNKLIRSCCESYEIVNCYINLVIYSLSLQPNLFNIEL